MPYVYCIDDGGDGTQTNATHTATVLDWTKADTTIANLLAYDAAAFTTSGNVIYFGHNTTQTQASALTITGPTSGLPVILISATQGTATPTYQASATNQIETTGANAITFDGSFALYGIRVNSGSDITLAPDLDETFLARGCTFAPAANKQIFSASTANGVTKLENCTIDLTADGVTTRAASVISVSLAANALDISGMSFTNPGYRTGAVFAISAFGALRVDASDLSGFTQATCEIMAQNLGRAVLTNIKTPATTTLFDATAAGASLETLFTNYGNSNAPTAIAYRSYVGNVLSTTSIYRSGGAQIGSTNVGWLITTTANCGEGAPFHTPWIYGNIASTGSKTFDVYTTNDTADLTDAEAWLEVEYLATSGSGQWTLASDQRTITTTAVAQTDDVTSTWNGSGPAFTYKQKLSVTATVNQTGQFRARVAVGKASIASSAYMYIDPRAFVT